MLKLAGFFKACGYNYELITDPHTDLDDYTYVYLSQVFTFTNLPPFVDKFKTKHPRTWNQKLKMGGTGFYAIEEDIETFMKKRREDMEKLSMDPFLKTFSMAHQMPDYTIYNTYIAEQIDRKTQESIKLFIKKEKRNPNEVEIEVFKVKHRKYFKDYLDYSIGFLTRGCIRQCPFCVNKNEKAILPYSQLADFVNENRPYIYLWDDNFLCYKNWKELLQQLIDTGKPFQFRQGLDERVLDEERAKMLSKARYHGDFIFAFDRWQDKDLIERKLKIWKRYCATKTTKFYLFCGYELTANDDNKIFNDVYYLFRRIEILMRYGCLGYVMRHADYQNHPLGNIYTQIARWCNQPQFYKKMSFWEFIERNQTYQEENSKSTRTCKSLITYKEFQKRFADRWLVIEPLFKMKYEQLVDPNNWMITI